MEKRNIIVIGASTGGFEALQKIVSSLPTDWDASIFIVWHMSADVQGILPQVLNKINTIKATNAIDGETILSNHIYVAPPDHHMLIEDGRIRVTHGPKENRFRPSIDPLFRSAAIAYTNRVIGVILSGGLDDGSSGLSQIKAQGGLAIVQDPKDCLNPSMPQSAMKVAEVDYCLFVTHIAEMLVQLSSVQVLVNQASTQYTTVNAEIAIAAEGNALKHFALGMGQLSPYSCPECHGVLSQIMEKQIIRFRCHTGHAYSADSLLLALSEKTEENIYQVIRGMDETIFLLNHMGDHYAAANEAKLAGLFFKEAKNTLDQSAILRRLAHEQRQISQERLKLKLSTMEGSQPG